MTQKLTVANTQKYDDQSIHERISTSSRDSLNASAHGNGFVMSSLQHCVLLQHVRRKKLCGSRLNTKKEISMFPIIRTIFYQTVILTITIALLTLLGCSASTTFKPPDNHRAYLALEKGEFAVVKDSVTQKISDKPENFFECDPVAQNKAKNAKQSFKSGQTSPDFVAGTPKER